MRLTAAFMVAWLACAQKDAAAKKGNIVQEYSDATRSVLFTLAVIAIIVVLLRSIVLELRRRPVVIEPIEVPKTLADKGYTPQVIAQRIAVEIGMLYRSARVSAGRLEDAFELSVAQVDFVMPASGVSYRTLVRCARQVLRRPDERVTGEIIDTQRSPQHLRAWPGTKTGFRACGTYNRGAFAPME